MYDTQALKVRMQRAAIQFSSDRNLSLSLTSLGALTTLLIEEFHNGYELGWKTGEHSQRECPRTEGS